MNDATNVIRRPISAESAIMHPTQRILALRAERQLQIFNVELKQKVKSHLMDTDITFWKWIDEKTIGIVTETSVFHWSMEGGDAPAQVFSREANLNGHQIINYRVTPDGKWMCLVGISSNSDPQGFKIKGSMQLYNRERAAKQCIEGHAAAFATIRLDGSPVDTNLFTFAVRTATGAKLHIVEIDHNSAAPVYQKKAVDIFFPPEATADFPVAMQVSQRYGIVYMITKYGFIHLYE